MALCGRNKYILELNVTGNRFPFRSLEYKYDFFRIKTNIIQNMYIDLNDGIGTRTILLNSYLDQIRINDVLSDREDNDLNIRGFIFNDGDRGERTINIWFDFPLEITELSFYYMFLYGDCMSNIKNYKYLTEFNLVLNSYLTSVGSFLNIPLKSITISNAFINDYFKYSIPIDLLSTNLERLTVNNNPHGKFLENGYKTNNWEHINLLKNTLLGFSAAECSNPIPRQGFLNSLSECIKLDSFNYRSNNLTTLPSSFVDSLETTDIKNLTYGDGSNASVYESLLSFGDASRLIKLTSISVDHSRLLTTEMPNYLRYLPKLKQFIISHCFLTDIRFDEVINSLYNIISIYGNMDNDDDLIDVPLRNFIVKLKGDPKGQGYPYPDEYIIQGTYQQPTGYEQGVSNGTPTSQLEKIWVLEHQYNVSVSYTDNR